MVVKFNGLPIKDVDRPPMCKGIYELSNGIYTDSIIVMDDCIQYHWDRKRNRTEGAWSSLPYFYDAYREMLLELREEEKYGRNMG